ncbi:Os04g0549000 [Oryza sativa Japonica Group]|uniref:Os04g0549000 protein n=1 Tax=Oryza sativa subsp. japonica TaxID=39947 RepID=A0A0N7KJG6_ORYSJ|nr:Os04g0549000 [Oryza sativa Japonica Group]
MPQPPPSVCTRSVTSVALPTHGDGGGCCRVPLSPFDAYWVALLDSLKALLPAFYRFASALVYSPEEEEEEGSLSIVVEAGGGVAFVEAEAFVASVVRSPRGMMVAGLGPRFAMQQQPTVFALPPPPPPQ